MSLGRRRPTKKDLTSVSEKADASLLFLYGMNNRFKSLSGR
ncbi:hypothetical protein Sez_0161 [Streptococcus equi subsp. zooepidemicus MGCS10565]|uniref:Uncharacterized protein n=1 Tax=Streptococcus equi subsp. zooepidemicus (strain MGCS10565) TaxID=552526 RepID=B4U096_STREM|nr:hypothetical protein Sez_0161 [Streptococcus equi subsp. zooepidemicus MGCS10565]